MAGNTPFRRWKREVHEGGIADPCIVSWPSRIASRDAIRHQFAHAIDVLPTVLELIGVEPPEEIAGVPAVTARGHELRLPPRRRRCARAAHDPVLRDARQPRHLPRGLEGGDVQAAWPRCTTTASIPTRRSRTTCGSCTTSPTTFRSATTSPRQHPDVLDEARRPLVGRGRAVQGAAARQPPGRRAARAAAARLGLPAVRVLAGGVDRPRDGDRQRAQPLARRWWLTWRFRRTAGSRACCWRWARRSAAGRSTCSTVACVTCTTTWAGRAPSSRATTSSRPDRISWRCRS